ncbi:MAG: hypothetical protein K2R98_14180 [Gemmataceae bacterium]|nr:hypothetical protein [Gemmataceae bacterium]
MVSRAVQMLSALLFLVVLAPGTLHADDKDAEIDQLRKKVQTLEKQLADLKVEHLKQKDKALQLQVKALEKSLADLMTEYRKLELVAKAALESQQKLEAEYQAAVKRHQKLEAEYREILKQLEAYTGGKGVVSPRNPPKDDVKGRVTAVDAESGQVTISVGKDAGLEKGQTLGVYRLKPKPVYVGMLRIVEVKKTEAIGKLTSRGADAPAVQVDDEVSSTLGK